MTEESLASARRKLLALQAEILNEGDLAIEPGRKDQAQVGEDEDSAPLTEMNQVIASNRNRSRTELLRKVQAALRRLETSPETFGLCLDCEEPMGRRLELLPFAELCLDCQQERDRSVKGGRRRHAGDFG